MPLEPPYWPSNARPGRQVDLSLSRRARRRASAGPGPSHAPHERQELRQVLPERFDAASVGRLPRRTWAAVGSVLGRVADSVRTDSALTAQAQVSEDDGRVGLYAGD